MIIWVDADGCPRAVLETVYKTSLRTKVLVKLVADSLFQHKGHSLVEFIKVERGCDAADIYIIENCQKHDIVISDDIPLAYQAIQKGASVIGKRGEIYSEENISSRLSSRDLMEELRQLGLVQGGPRPFQAKDSGAFANSLDRTITALLKKSQNS